jgi:hypothetical protein
MTGMEAAPKKKGIAMLFSGGLDTTLEVVARLDEYESIYLLTFNNGYCINMGGARRRALELGRVFGPGRIRHEEADTSPLLKKLLHDSGGVLDQFKSPLVFDLACKVSAVVELVYFAKVNGLSDVTDGSSEAQTEIFLQDPEFAAHIKPAFARYGLSFIRPFRFHMGRDEKIELLRKHGLRRGVKALEKVFITSQLVHQPFCLRGCVTYFFTSPLRHLSIVDRIALPMDKAKAAWDAVAPIALDWLDQRLAEAGVATGPGESPAGEGSAHE